MTNSGYTHVEVQPSDNCPMSAQQVYRNMGQPFAVSQVRIYEGDIDGTLYEVVGWSSAGNGTPIAAHGVQVEDSSAGAAFLVYGGDWGLRLRPVGSTEAWHTAQTDQIGETHLVLSDAEDLITG